MKFLDSFQIEAFSQKGFVVIDDWLSSLQIKNLHFEFDELFRGGAFKKAQITGAANLIRGDWTYWLDSKLPPTLHRVHKELNSWAPSLNQNFYCGVTNIEAHLAHYPPGLGYEKHWDQPKGKEHRKISFVLYLNPHWLESDGGELLLYADGQDPIEKIAPNGGRLVMFRSDLFPHEVRASLRPRRSLTGWFRNDAV
jgi:SM-20-related protein